MRTEGRLPQEGGHKFVPVHLMNPSSHCTSPSIKALSLHEFPPRFFTRIDTARKQIDSATGAVSVAPHAAACLWI